jgi:hypothetical protein
MKAQSPTQTLLPYYHNHKNQSVINAAVKKLKSCLQDILNCTIHPDSDYFGLYTLWVCL